MDMIDLSLKQDALDFFLSEGVLRFGEFTLKSGRKSPYFFNTGLLCTGSQLLKMGELYGRLVESMDESKDATVIFGSAYKGIPIAVATTSWLAHRGRGDLRSLSDRKEAKRHGDRGDFLGDIREGDKAIIVDDVITDGATKLEAIEKLRVAGVEPVALVIAFDRHEIVGEEGMTAVERFSTQTGLPVRALLSIKDVIEQRADLAPVLRLHLAS
jgi:orotate phosphoribosyltransferase